MYIAKIPGTKYITSLESQGGNWYLRLKLDGVVEAEEEIDQLGKKSIHKHLNQLFDQVSLQINSFQVDLIHKELVAQIAHLLTQDQQSSKSAKSSTSDDGPRYDPRVDPLLDRIEKLENLVSTLKDRVERMESLSE